MAFTCWGGDIGQYTGGGVPGVIYGGGGGGGGGGGTNTVENIARQSLGLFTGQMVGTVPVGSVSSVSGTDGQLGLFTGQLVGTVSGGGTVTTSFTNSDAGVEFSQAGTLNQFNPGLGTLTAATLTITVHAASVNGSVTRNATAGSFTINQTITIDCNPSSDLTSLDAIINGTPITLTMAGTPFSMAPSTTHTFFSSATGSTTSGSISLASILADLTGTGTFQIFGDSTTGASASGSNIASSSHSESAGFNASITYTYT